MAEGQRRASGVKMYTFSWFSLGLNNLVANIYKYFRFKGIMYDFLTFKAKNGPWTGSTPGTGSTL